MLLRPMVAPIYVVVVVAVIQKEYSARIQIETVMENAFLHFLPHSLSLSFDQNHFKGKQNGYVYLGGKKYL